MIAIAQLLNPRMAILVSLIVSLVALGTAFIAQLGFGLKPCIMCLWQRLPYALVILGSIPALFILPRAPKLTPVFLACLSLFFLSGFGLAFFHIGIEQHWWELSGGCPIEPLGNKTPEQALAELLTTPTSSCDKIAWQFLGFSITVWNAALSLGMAAYLALMAINLKSEE